MVEINQVLLNVPDFDTSAMYIEKIYKTATEVQTLSLLIIARLTYQKCQAGYLIELYNETKDISVVITIPDEYIYILAQSDLLRNAQIKSNELVGRKCDLEDLPIANIESIDELDKFIVEIHLDKSGEKIRYKKKVSFEE